MDTSSVTTRAVTGSRRLAICTLAAGALSLVGSMAFAQNEGSSQPTVTVQAPHVVQRSSIGAGGMAVERLSLRRKVSFADLNLDTPDGRAALMMRIRANARAACEELGVRNPTAIWVDDVQSCVQQAMRKRHPEAVWIGGV